MPEDDFRFARLKRFLDEVDDSPEPTPEEAAAVYRAEQEAIVARKKAKDAKLAGRSIGKDHAKELADTLAGMTWDNAISSQAGSLSLQVGGIPINVGAVLPTLGGFTPRSAESSSAFDALFSRPQPNSIRQDHREQLARIPVFCQHLNEVPSICPCHPSCGCKTGTCHSTPSYYSRDVVCECGHTQNSHPSNGVVRHGRCTICAGTCPQFVEGCACIMCVPLGTHTSMSGVLQVRAQHRQDIQDEANSPVFCDHANEVPFSCPCGPACYCKSHACRSASTTCRWVTDVVCECGHTHNGHSPNGTTRFGSCTHCACTQFVRRCGCSACNYG